MTMERTRKPKFLPGLKQKSVIAGKTKYFVSILLLCSLKVVYVSAHTRLECPPPRSAETGAKEGPCDAPDDLSLQPYPLHPGLNTVTWLESISHPGAPARFALSLDGSDEGFESCVLLDHVPHDEQSLPDFMDPLTYHRSSITLFIPDVKCERCNLQIISFMTDEIHGLPIGDTCAYKGAQFAGTADSSLEDCKVVYHSCAPVTINGTVPRDQYKCSLDEFHKELDWPFMEGKPPASTYYYKGDPGMYNRDTARLLSGGSPIEGCSNFLYCDPTQFYNATSIVPDEAKYASPIGTCAAVIEKQVEPFALGELPSIQKSEVTQDNFSTNGHSGANMEDIMTTNNSKNETDEQISSTSAPDDEEFPSPDVDSAGSGGKTKADSSGTDAKIAYFTASCTFTTIATMFLAILGGMA